MFEMDCDCRLFRIKQKSCVYIIEASSASAKVVLLPSSASAKVVASSSRSPAAAKIVPKADNAEKKEPKIPQWVRFSGSAEAKKHL